jgi:hypothetical protein
VVGILSVLLSVLVSAEFAASVVAVFSFWAILRGGTFLFLSFASAELVFADKAFFAVFVGFAAFTGAADWFGALIADQAK